MDEGDEGREEEEDTGCGRSAGCAGGGAATAEGGGVRGGDGDVTGGRAGGDRAA